MSDIQESAGQLFRAGRLAAAIEAASQAVRKAPGDLGARMLLAELLLFGGNIERADVILDAAEQIDPGAMAVIAEFRQLLRAEMARRQVYRDGRAPEMLSEPTDAQKHVLAAMIALRAGDSEAASREAAAAEASRPHVTGKAAGIPFDDFRDADDFCTGFFEVLTTTGKYFWIPTEQVESISFHAAKRPRDLAWRRASMSVRGGPDGDVYIPVMYWSDNTGLSEELRLGRQTDWHGEGPVRGEGQRVFLAGEDALEIMALTEIEFGA